METHITLTEPAPGVRVAPVALKADRLESIDLLRGAVMIIMALDHVRDFFSERMLMDPTDLQTTTPGIFLTRWITHYCAPTFMFLAGTGAFLYGTRGKTTSQVSWFLFTRGLWLAFLEVTINRALWMSNFDFQHHGAGVFWAIGWSMVLLSVLVYLPTSVVTLVGVGLIVLHNMLDGLTAQQVHMPGWLWMILHNPGDQPVVGNITFGTGYCLLPWMGTMAAGYGFGTLMLQDRAVRRPQLFQLGAAVTLGFIFLRLANVYGDPRPWTAQSGPMWTFFSFLNCTKYPASLMYLMMTLGPAIMFLAIFDRPLGRWAKPIITFGRVPLFFYLLHILLIHGGAIILDWLRFGWSPLFGNGPWFKRVEAPVGFGVSLPVVYLVWVALILILYWPCKWYADVKRRHPGGLLSYL